MLKRWKYAIRCRLPHRNWMKRNHAQLFCALEIVYRICTGRYENVSFSVTLTEMSILIHDLSLMSAKLYEMSLRKCLFL